MCTIQQKYKNKGEWAIYRVMVVDDEEIIVTGLVRSMPWEKYHCRVEATALDGLEALKIIRGIKPDILFTDICMPGADGLAVIAAVRSEFPHMQVTILSGYPNFEYAQKAIDLGVVRYLLKPSKFAQLEDALVQMTKNLKKLPSAVDEEAGKPEDIIEQQGTVDDTAEKAQNFIVKNAVAYINEHYAQKLTLSDVADHVYVSQWHLSKLISRYSQQSFFDLLNGIRIEKAKELLGDPALKIWEVSEQVGFTDATHFSRTFKKLTGMSANEYRAKN